jgi:hypothetical protein
MEAVSLLHKRGGFVMRWSSLLRLAVKPVLLFLIASLVPARNTDYGITASSGAHGDWPAGSRYETSAALSSSIAILVCTAIATVLFFVLPGEARAAETKVEAETMTLPGTSSVVVHSKSAASGGQEVAFFSNGSARSTFDGAVTNITLRARGRACQGNPQLKVYVDDVLKGTVEPISTTFADYTVALSGLSAGSHTLRITFENDFYNSDCDRNAFLDYYVFTLSDTPPPTSDDAVLVGAGKIAHCATTGDEATAKLLDSIPGTVFTAGDNAYNSGTAAEFNDCYDPTWGRHKTRTRPTLGQHDYGTPGATGYFGYFGAAAGDPTKGYYSYNLGEWHVIALNSSCGNVVGGCGATSPMVTWLKQDLAANPRACALAYFNHPLFSSGRHGNQTQVKPIWDALYAADAEVIINSRDHDYERFAPQDPYGTVDLARGIREFVVGTGGAGLYSFDLGIIKPNSEVRNDKAYGVLKLTLHPTSYDWQFVPVAGQTFTDSGTTSCH